MTCQGPCHLLMAGVSVWDQDSLDQLRSDISLWFLLGSLSSYQFLCFAGTQVLLHVVDSHILGELASFLLIFVGDLREKTTVLRMRDWTLGLLYDIFDVVFTLTNNYSIIKTS